MHSLETLDQLTCAIRNRGVVSRGGNSCDDNIGLSCCITHLYEINTIMNSNLVRIHDENLNIIISMINSGIILFGFVATMLQVNALEALDSKHRLTM